MTEQPRVAVRAGNRAFGPADALWLLGSALVALAICAGVMTIVMHLDRPAQAVQQACITTTAARG